MRYRARILNVIKKKNGAGGNMTFTYNITRYSNIILKMLESKSQHQFLCILAQRD